MEIKFEYSLNGKPLRDRAPEKYMLRSEVVSSVIKDVNRRTGGAVRSEGVSDSPGDRFS